MTNPNQCLKTTTTTTGDTQIKPGAPVDAEELTRRLAAHMADIKRQNQRRAQCTAVLPHGPYHHVPRVAAADFARTATPDSMRRQKQNKRDIHKLAQPALKHHLKGNSHYVPFGGGMSGWRFAQTVDNLRAETGLVRERNQFQRTSDLERAAQLDRIRDVHKPQQRAFDNDILHMRGCQDCARSGPLSMRGLEWEQEQVHAQSAMLYSDPEPKAKLVHQPLDRHDWVQRDDTPVEQRKSTIRILRDKCIGPNKEATTESSHCDSFLDMNPIKGAFLGLFKK